MAKKKIAVLFGGRSPEHDVSVISALQALQAIDIDRYEAFPVYISVSGEWLVGEPLRKRENYLPNDAVRGGLRAVTLDITPTGHGALRPTVSGLFGAGKSITFDVALPIFHGLFGEDGNIQGLFELAGVPYTGMRTMASALFMDKAVTKQVARDLGIPVLPFVRANKSQMRDTAFLQPQLQALKATHAVQPNHLGVIVKPNHLGSSIGVAAVKTMDELAEVAANLFRYDDTAIIEPCLQNFSEYNVAVTRYRGQIVTSAIERPKRTDELLTFKEKYMSGGGKKLGGQKTPGTSSEGMLSLTRELNPTLPGGVEQKIRDYSMKIFAAVGGTGVPRLDFIHDDATGQIYLNEINPCPGSLGFFLWEASKTNRIGYVDLLTHLIEEALVCRDTVVLPPDPVPADARLLKRP